MTDRERVLQALRDAGPAGLHSMTARRRGLSGNVSERVRELRDRGCVISAESKPWKDANGKLRPGTIYTLISEPDRGLGTGTADERPCEPLADASAVEGEQAASAEPEAGALFEMPELEPEADYRDPDQRAA